MTEATRCLKKPKVALITGAGGIIGPAICRLLQDRGWTVAATDHEEVGFDIYESINDQPFPCNYKDIVDLSSRTACHQLVKRTEAAVGGVSLLVNNAAMNPSPPHFEEIDEDYLNKMTMVNLWAPHFLLQACLPHMRRARTGSVVNMSSIMVKRPYPQQLIYPELKASLEAMTKMMSLQLAADHITVNAIRVGLVPGYAFMRDTLKSLSKAEARELYEEILPKHLDAARTMNPTGQVTRPADIAELVAFLASEAARQINGCVIPLDGGFSNVLRPHHPNEEDWNSNQAVETWVNNRVHN